MRICDKFQSKIHKTDIMLFSGEQSIPETEYLVKLYIILAVNNMATKDHVVYSIPLLQKHPRQNSTE